MCEGVLLPTLNYVKDAALPDARINDQAVDYDHKLALLNSFGFGGTNASLVVESVG
jgi:3-oxoacyl-(acyl-carrier-protein) synthase